MAQRSHEVTHTSRWPLSRDSDRHRFGCVCVCVGNTLRPHPRIEHLDFKRGELKVKRSGLIGERCSDGSKDTQTLHWRRVSRQSVAWSEDRGEGPGRAGPESRGAGARRSLGAGP